jgi:uncharacterized tellurite resistance protein B-like protein
MSLIDRALKGQPADPPVLPVPDAIAAILVAAAAADGRLNEEEAVRMSGILSTTRVLRQAGNGSMQGLAERAIALLTDYGLPAELTACAKAIPADLRPTTFALATDLVLADGRIDDREKTFIDELQAVLDVDDATALKIVDVLLIKNHG